MGSPRPSLAPVHTPHRRGPQPVTLPWEDVAHGAEHDTGRPLSAQELKERIAELRAQEQERRKTTCDCGKLARYYVCPSAAGEDYGDRAGPPPQRYCAACWAKRDGGA